VQALFSVMFLYLFLPSPSSYEPQNSSFWNITYCINNCYSIKNQ
jgi:hypothetical protein